MSKIGNLSWGGYLNDVRVKVYQTSSPKHAEYIERISRDSQVGRYFPKVISRCDEYLAVEWIHGSSLSPGQTVNDLRMLEQITGLQAMLHSQAVRVEAAPFSYLDYLESRFRRYLGPFDQTDAVSKVIESARQSVPTNIEMRVSHMDVTPSNLVVESGTGALKVVDNELLTQSPYYSIDLFNTYQSLGCSNDLAQKYLTLYARSGGDLSPLLEHRPFFLAMWALRHVGALLQAGDVPAALHVAERLRSDQFTSHPLIFAVDRIVR